MLHALWFKASLGFEIVPETLSQKYSTQSRAGGEAQEVQSLPSRYKALSLSPRKKRARRQPLDLPTWSLLGP
jgi:hypothetical protein